MTTRSLVLTTLVAGTASVVLIDFPLSGLLALLAVASGLLAVAQVGWRLVRRRGEPLEDIIVGALALVVGMAAASFTILVPVTAFLEAQVRAKVARARKDLDPVMRALQGLSGKERAEYLGKAGLGTDPFRRQQPYQFQVLAGGEVALWSLGPDERDQSGQIVYDPTNGTTSAGDVVVRVPVGARMEKK